MAWRKFWFEGNHWFKWVNSPEDWEDLKKTYASVGTDIDKLMGTLRSDVAAFDKFGFAPECRGKETLGDFFKKNNMKI